MVENPSENETDQQPDELSSGMPRVSAHENEEEEKFVPASEIFQDPSEFDYLAQHGGNSKETALARQSLYVKFDPFVPGRHSSFPPRTADGYPGNNH